MLGASRFRTGWVLAFVSAIVSAVVLCPVPSGPAGASSSGPPTFVGPVLTAEESPAISMGRDGGVSVPLPGGRDLWIFADGPRFQYRAKQHAWRYAGFTYGSSAAEQTYTTGRRFAAPLEEVVPGHPLSPTNHAAQLIPSPNLYLPDGSGRACTKANGGPATASVRWVTGAALLPDQTNVVIAFVDVCVTTPGSFTVEGWGFTEYDWSANRISVAPIDVFPAATSGAEIPQTQLFRSPVVVGNTVTFFSQGCCSPGAIYTTTMAADTATLSNPASYVSQPIAGLPWTYAFSVVGPSSFSPDYLMYWTAGTNGQYRIYSSAQPSGPWSLVASDTLPRCATNPYPCNNASMYMHPELSSGSQLLVSYFLPAYGPGIATKHPYPHLPLGHVIWSTVPV